MAKSNDISVRQVGPKAAKRSIRKAIQTRRPTFLWGPPGIGKSDIVKQIGQDAGREVIDVRLALWEPTDIKGVTVALIRTASGVTFTEPVAETVIVLD